jgi:hypothetical protein
LLKEGVDFGFLEEENAISFMVFFLVGGKATHVIYQPRQRSIEQVVTRQKASHVSDRRLEEAHGLVVRTDTPVDVGDVIHDLVDDHREFHDQGGRQSVDCGSTPAIPDLVSCLVLGHRIGTVINSPRVARCVADWG